MSCALNAPDLAVANSPRTLRVRTPVTPSDASSRLSPGSTTACRSVPSVVAVVASIPRPAPNDLARGVPQLLRALPPSARTPNPSRPPALPVSTPVRIHRPCTPNVTALVVFSWLLPLPPPLQLHSQSPRACHLSSSPLMLAGMPARRCCIIM